MRVAVREVEHWRNTANAIRAIAGTRREAVLELHEAGVRMRAESADKAAWVEAATCAELGEAQGVVSVSLQDLAAALARAVAVGAREVALEATAERASLEYVSPRVRLTVRLPCLEGEGDPGAPAGFPPGPPRPLARWAALLAGVRRVRTAGCVSVALEACGGELIACTRDNHESAPVTGRTVVGPLPDASLDGFRGVYCIQRILAFADLFPADTVAHASSGDSLVVRSGPNSIVLAPHLPDDEL